MKFKSRLSQSVRWALISATTVHLALSPLVGGISVARAEAAAGVVSGQVADLVEQGIAQLKAGRIDQAISVLREAKAMAPAAAAPDYYLGVAHLRQNDLGGTMRSWRSYLEAAPTGPQADMIRQNLTLVAKEEARQFARQAVSREQALTATAADPNTVGVTYFQNLGRDSLAPLEKGMTSMVINDLAQVPGLQVVERVRLQALMDELKLSRQKLVDPKTAPRMGRLMRAGKVVSGNLLDSPQAELQVNSSVAETATGGTVKVREATGELKRFFEVQKEITNGVLSDLGYGPDAVPSSVQRIHTTDFEAFRNYALGLDHLDADRFDEARSSFQEAVRLDPSFELARAALLATPIVAASLSLIAAQAAEQGPAAGVAGGSGGAGSSAAGSSAGTAAGSAAGASAAGGLSIGAVAAGVGVAAAAVGAAASSMSDDGHTTISTTATSQ